MPIFYHSGKTKAQRLVSRLKQRSLLEKGNDNIICRRKQSDIATYYSVGSDLVY